MYILTSIVLSCLFRKQGVHMIILIKSIIRSVQNPWFERKWFQFLHLFWFNSAGEKRSKIVWKNNFDTNGRDHAESFVLFHTELGMIKALPELWRKIETIRALWSSENDRVETIIIYRSLFESIPKSNQSSWHSRFQSWYGSPSYRSPFLSNKGSFQKPHSLLERTASERTLNRPANIILSEHRTLSATPSLGVPYLQTPTRKP